MRLAAAVLTAMLLVGPPGSALAQPAEADAAAPDAIAASRHSLSDRGLTFIERHEGFVGHVYNDSAGHYSQVPAQMMRWTIGGLESRRRDEVRLWKYGQYT